MNDIYHNFFKEYADVATGKVFRKSLILLVEGYPRSKEKCRIMGVANSYR